MALHGQLPHHLPESSQSHCGHDLHSSGFIIDEPAFEPPPVFPLTDLACMHILAARILEDVEYEAVDEIQRISKAEDAISTWRSRLVLYTDSSNGLAYSVTWRSPNCNTLWHDSIHRLPCKIDNNWAELLAIYKATEIAYQKVAQLGNKITTIIVYTDSQTAINTITGFQAQSASTQRKFHFQQELAYLKYMVRSLLESGIHFDIRWVKAHDSAYSLGNHRADRLAGHAATSCRLVNTHIVQQSILTDLSDYPRKSVVELTTGSSERSKTGLSKERVNTTNNALGRPSTSVPNIKQGPKHAGRPTFSKTKEVLSSRIEKTMTKIKARVDVKKTALRVYSRIRAKVGYGAEAQSYEEATSDDREEDPNQEPVEELDTGVGNNFTVEETNLQTGTQLQPSPESTVEQNVMPHGLNMNDSVNDALNLPPRLISHRAYSKGKVELVAC